MSRFCSNCGAQMEDNALFCPKCGNAIASTATAGDAIASTATAGNAVAGNAVEPPVQNPAPHPAMQPEQPQQPVYNQPNPGYNYPGGYPAYQAPKKSNKGLIIGIVCAVAAIAIGLLIFFLVRGGGSGGSAAGSYKVKTVNGEDVEEYLSILGDDFISLELKSDGTGSITMYGEGLDLTWSQSGSSVSLTAEGETITGTLSGKQLTLSGDGDVIVFEKK